VKVTLAAEAEPELVEGARFYAAQANAELGRAFILEFERAINLLRSQPALGAPWRAGTRRMPLRRFPYSIVYELRAAELRVLALTHQRRTPGYWSGRT
jgi:plasmid stabilization system protein ParE